MIARYSEFLIKCIVFGFALALLGISGSLVHADPIRSLVTGKPELVIDGLKIDYPTWAFAADPTLGHIDGQWWMFFNSISSSGGRIHIIAATLPKGSPLSSSADKWDFVRNGSQIMPIISPHTDGGWDTHATETADYVKGYDASARKWVERLYFAGWPPPTAEKIDYRVSYAELSEGKWLKRKEPVLAGEESWEKLNAASSFVGDQGVIYEHGLSKGGEDGAWHMWYQTGSPEGVSLGHAVSRDGIKWSGKQRLKHKVPFADGGKNTGPFHLDVAKHKGRYVFVGWVGDAPTLNSQGLWIVTSSTPEGTAPGDFKDWKPLLLEKGGEAWYFAGEGGSKCHSTGLFSATLEVEGDALWVYFSGISLRAGSRNDPCTDKGANVASIGRLKVSGF